MVHGHSSGAIFISVNKNCFYIKKINYDFYASEYKYYDDVIERPQNNAGHKKYVIIKKKSF